MPPTVSIVLPCLNEIGGIRAVVREAQQAISAAGVEGEVVVVDNGSTDGSPDAAREAGARVVAEMRRGYGAALMAGFAAARGDVVVMADADQTYDLSALPRFLDRIASGDDLVMGDRFGGSIADGAMPWLHRYVGSPVLSGLLNLLFGTAIRDAHCGIRAFRRDALQRMQLRMPGMELASEMIVNAARAGLRIGEVPVDYRPRIGASKLHSLRDGWRHLRFLMLYSPTHLFLVPGVALLSIGMALQLLLLRGPLRLGVLAADVHVMVLGALLALLGFQIVIAGVHAKALAAALGLQPADRTLRAVRRVFSLERALALGIAMFALGLLVDVAIVSGWVASGLGPLDEVRRAVFATVAMLLGTQLAFASLFLSAIDLQTLGERRYPA